MNEDIKSLMNDFNITLLDMAKKLNMPIYRFYYRLNNSRFNLTEKKEMKKNIQEIAEKKIEILEKQDIEELKKEFAGKANIEIRVAMKFNGITQQEFADHIYMTSSAFCRKLQTEIPEATTKLYLEEINKMMEAKKEKIKNIC